MAERSSKQERRAHYIYSQEKGAVKANLELSAPFLFIETEIPVREQCYPKRSHCPTTLNSIKISPHRACPEIRPNGDLKFCQADN